MEVRRLSVDAGGAQSVGSCESAPLLVRDFVWGDPERCPEVVAMQTYTIYFPEPEDPPVSVPSAAYHYLHDVLGSVIGLVNDAGELVEQYTYDPYGKVFIEKWDAAANGGNGEWAASETDCGSSTCGKLPVSSVGNPFMWTGHRYDAAVGLYATHFRTYSPTLGRWLQRDPIEYDGGSSNLYEYVRSSPTQWFDPLGLSPGELRRKLKKLCATKICPDRAKRFKWGENGEACFYSDPDAYDQCNKDCESEADKIVNCLEAVIASANRGRGAICTNINPYSEHKACQLSLDFFKVEAFRPTRCRDNKPGRHVVTGIGPTGSDNYDVIVDALDWNNLFPPNLRLNILEPNSEGLLEDHLASQGGERHRTDGPRFPPTDPPPWERNPGIFPPE